jgi:hypothetical protein
VPFNRAAGAARHPCRPFSLAHALSSKPRQS